MLQRERGKMTVDILGTEYTVCLDVDEKDDVRLKKADGENRRQ